MIDQNSDTTFKVLHSILQDTPHIKEHVKTASVGDSVRDSLPKSCFADTDNKLFPIHTRPDAILSKSYATKVAGIAADVMSKIDNALRVFEVDASIFNKQSATKQASANTPTYILPSKKAMKIASAKDLEVAEYRVKQLGNKLGYADKVEASTRLVNAARFFNKQASVESLQMSGLTRCDLEKAASWIEARAVSAKTRAQSDVYYSLANSVKTAQDADRDSLLKVASALEVLDKFNNLERYYDKYLPDPMKTVFNTKVAMENCVYIDGVEIPFSSLDKYTAQDIGDMIGDDIVPEISDADGSIDPSKFSEIVPTLPKDMKDILMSKMKV